MTAGKKYTLSTLLFYILFLSLVPVVEHFSPGGPCVPGGGIFLLLLAPLLSGLGFILSVVIRLKGHRVVLGPLFINALIFVASLVLFGWARFF